jgi:NAD(P)-dependent dehydrogenase (short-subunit alcohol dehydrogenase family)
MRFQTIFITGIHTGLGNALTQALLDKGAEVFAVSRQRPDDLHNAARLQFCSLDLSHTDQIGEGIREFLAPVRQLDLVLLNAGVLGEIKDLHDTGLDEIATVMDINVWANKLIYDTLLEMQIQIRQLVAISSGAAFNGSGGWGAYSISKSALNLMFRVYAHENPDTHFICLAPGLVQTKMLDYVCSLDVDQRYPAVGRIRSAVGTDGMQTTSQAARRLLDVFPRLLEYPTGSYVDIRDM